jgi:hypothetical protein
MTCHTYASAYRTPRTTASRWSISPRLRRVMAGSCPIGSIPGTDPARPATSVRSLAAPAGNEFRSACCVFLRCLQAGAYFGALHPNSRSPTIAKRIVLAALEVGASCGTAGVDADRGPVERLGKFRARQIVADPHEQRRQAVVEPDTPDAVVMIGQVEPGSKQL